MINGWHAWQPWCCRTVADLCPAAFAHIALPWWHTAEGVSLCERTPIADKLCPHLALNIATCPKPRPKILAVLSMTHSFATNNGTVNFSINQSLLYRFLFYFFFPHQKWNNLGAWRQYFLGPTFPSSLFATEACEVLLSMQDYSPCHQHPPLLNARLLLQPQR